MATYAFRCSGHGDFDRQYPLGTAPDRVSCGRCGTAARRVFTAPMLSTVTRARSRAADLAGLSAERPQVTTQLPRTAADAARSRRTDAGPDPRHRLLPRP